MHSGSPGYIKGKPLLIGTPIPTPGGSDSTAFYGVDYSHDGFSLRGADNDGKCYFLKEPVADGISADTGNWGDELTVETINEKRYYDDPVLTFEDAMVFGCTLELNAEELEQFCTSKKWKNLMIFQNLLQLKLVGKYGNSNPHFLKDWTDIITPEETEGVFEDEVCEFPSVRVVEIFY